MTLSIKLKFSKKIGKPSNFKKCAFSEKSQFLDNSPKKVVEFGPSKFQISLLFSNHSLQNFTPVYRWFIFLNDRHTITLLSSSSFKNFYVSFDYQSNDFYSKIILKLLFQNTRLVIVRVYEKNGEGDYRFVPFFENSFPTFPLCSSLSNWLSARS